MVCQIAITLKLNSKKMFILSKFQRCIFCMNPNSWYKIQETQCELRQHQERNNILYLNEMTVAYCMYSADLAYLQPF